MTDGIGQGGRDTIPKLLANFCCSADAEHVEVGKRRTGDTYTLVEVVSRVDDCLAATNKAAHLVGQICSLCLL